MKSDTKLDQIRTYRQNHKLAIRTPLLQKKISMFSMFFYACFINFDRVTYSKEN